MKLDQLVSSPYLVIGEPGKLIGAGFRPHPPPT
jgi:hypothetical protein